jgi:DNA repair exonuclease SbcCD nuclease subunit
MPLNVGLQDLALARPALCLMSHIHMSQRWDLDDVPYLYAGSSYRTDYGQTEPKHVVLATFDGPHLADLRFIETPATPMLLIEAPYSDGEIRVPADQKEWIDESPAAEIRLRYACASDQREPAKIAAQRLADWLREQRGAVDVKVEEVVAVNTRARAPEITAARTLPDKLDALWRLQKFDPGERRPSLFEKVAQLEGELVGV